MGTTGTRCGLDENKQVNLSGSAPNHSKSQIANFVQFHQEATVPTVFCVSKKICHHGKLGIPGSASGRNAASPSAAWLFSTRWLACNSINSQSHIPRAIKSIGMIYPPINPNSEPMTTSIDYWGLLIKLLVSISGFITLSYIIKKSQEISRHQKLLETVQVKPKSHWNLPAWLRKLRPLRGPEFFLTLLRLGHGLRQSVISTILTYTDYPLVN